MIDAGIRIISFCQLFFKNNLNKIKAIIKTDSCPISTPILNASNSEMKLSLGIPY